ncbi:MAG: nucleotide sugar dehydrogenase [Saprospiraceae bacterium]|nr:nucleotide sugar dehydrogenase [Saprospiraceae bacterium]
MYEALLRKEKTIAVIGLGYVGLPLALEFAGSMQVLGFDVKQSRVDELNRQYDSARQVSEEHFLQKDIRFTADPAALQNAHFYIVAVPTAVDDHKVPDLRPLYNASETIARYLKPGDYVVFESTTYPGCTEEECIPRLEAGSGLRLNTDFKVGYSPERIDPGNREKGVADILKIVSGSDAESLYTVAKVYGDIIKAGIYEAPSIKVAEAAKVIENTQRDLNISLMNELSILFDRLGLDTQEVLKAAGTKWNFARYTPGLVGGHCIAVDPYYLLHKARQLGYDPQVILSGRRVNDGMPAHIAKKIVQTLIRRGKTPQHSRVLVMGIAFKENVPDIRNSRVVDLVEELRDFNISVDIIDPLADPADVRREYGLEVLDQPRGLYDAIVVAVGHHAFRSLLPVYFKNLSNQEPILFDLKALYDRTLFEPEFEYWRL